MSDEVKIAIISLISAGIVALFGFLGQISINNKKSREEEIKEAKREQEQEDRDAYFTEQIEKINHKLDEHNLYAKKFEEVNLNMLEMKKDIEYLRKDISNGQIEKKK